jgi:hypothetical protein
MQRAMGLLLIVLWAMNAQANRSPEEGSGTLPKNSSRPAPSPLNSPSFNCSIYEKFKTVYDVELGGRFCQNFKKNFDNFSVSTQKAINEIGTCLGEKRRCIGNDQSEAETMKKNVDAHFDCYIRSSFPELKLIEQLSVALFVGPELQKKEFLETAMKITSICAIAKMGQLAGPCTQEPKSNPFE